MYSNMEADSRIVVVATKCGVKERFVDETLY